MKIDHVIETLRAHAKPGNSYGALADALAMTGKLPENHRLVPQEPAPPPVAADTMDVARYELRISEAQLTILRTALQQSAVVAKHRAADEAEIVELDEMLASMDQLPTCNDFTL